MFGGSAPAEYTQGDLLSGAGPQLAQEEARARETVARLRTAVTAGKATDAQKERYREALALLRRGEAQSAEEVGLRSRRVEP